MKKHTFKTAILEAQTILRSIIKKLDASEQRLKDSAEKKAA